MKFLKSNKTILFLKRLALFILLTICILIASIVILYNTSKHKFINSVQDSISKHYDIDSYPIYIILCDTLDAIPIECNPNSAIPTTYVFDNTDITASVSVDENGQAITVRLSDTKHTGEILIYDSTHKKLYNVLKLSRIIYSNNYKITFSVSDQWYIVTFTLHY